MSTPFDINTPLPPNSDVVINHQDASQSVGTPTELQVAVDQGDVIGLQLDTVVDTAVEAPAEELVAEEAAAPVEESPAAPAEVPVEEPAPETPVEVFAETETPVEDASEPVEEAPAAPAGKPAGK